MKAEPFSYPVVAADIPAAGRRYLLQAEADERAGLAESLDIVAVHELAADVEVRPVLGGAYSVRGTVTARVEQTDVVTLDPVAQDIREDIDVTLMPAAKAAPSRGGTRELVDAVETEGPDLFENGRIDLGVIVGEHLALGLDPYPRAPETAFEGHIEDDPAADPSPFAGLAALKLRGE
jgi:hypothetical protein